MEGYAAPYENAAQKGTDLDYLQQVFSRGR